MEQVHIKSQGSPGVQGLQAGRGKTPASLQKEVGSGMQTPASGGFMSLLAGFDANESQEVLVLSVGSAASQNVQQPQDQSLMAPNLAQAGLLPQDPPGVGVAGSMPRKGAGATVDLGSIVAGDSLSTKQGVFDVNAAASGAPAGAETLQFEGLVAQTALLDAGEGKNGVGDVLAPMPVMAGSGRRLAGRTPAGGVSQALSQAGDAGAAAARSVSAGRGDSATSWSSEKPLSATLAVGGSLARASETVRGDRMEAFSETVSSFAVAAPWMADSAPGVRTQARGAEPGGTLQGGGLAPVEQGSEFSPGVAADTVALPAGAEEAVSEQVAFWVHQNIQKAELTVTHEGQPVEVSISLSGQETQVAFRTDQEQTRDQLDAGTGQLREMLNQEGLELAAVTVGQSGGRQGAQGDDGRQDAERRSKGQVVAPVAGSGRRQGADVLTDRSVDLFV